ncbi:MAG: cytochrome C [Alphaproteobacteria bacterium]|nr:cytochrome C [Alphaproteobacteria bacterium]
MGRAGTAAPLLAALLAGAPCALAADPGEKLAPCLACHGAEGQSELENVPSLGAQPAPYTVIQLFMFREKMRVAEPMNEMAKDLGDGELQSIADFLAKQPAPKPPADAGDPARLERARVLTEQSHCNICHRPDFSGRENVPRLADQREDYLLKTLRDYKSGARRGYDASMAEVLQPIDDAQLIEFAYYLSRLR